MPRDAIQKLLKVVGSEPNTSALLPPTDLTDTLRRTCSLNLLFPPLDEAAVSRLPDPLVEELLQQVHFHGRWDPRNTEGLVFDEPGGSALWSMAWRFYLAQEWISCQKWAEQRSELESLHYRVAHPMLCEPQKDPFHKALMAGQYGPGQGENGWAGISILRGRRSFGCIIATNTMESQLQSLDAQGQDEEETRPSIYHSELAAVATLLGYQFPREEGKPMIAVVINITHTRARVLEATLHATTPTPTLKLILHANLPHGLQSKLRDPSTAPKPKAMMSTWDYEYDDPQPASGDRTWCDVLSWCMYIDGKGTARAALGTGLKVAKTREAGLGGRLSPGDEEGLRAASGSTAASRRSEDSGDSRGSCISA